MNQVEPTKICKKCEKRKSLTEYFIDQRNKDKCQAICKECVRIHQREQYKKNPEIYITRSNINKIKHKDKIIIQNKQYYTKNRNKILDYQKFYQTNHKDKYNEIQRNYINNNINARIAKNQRCRINKALTNKIDKSQKTDLLLACTIDELKIHLEKQFKEGMTWENYGKTRSSWSVDHIIPCSYFDLSDPEQQMKCFHYTNLQPLWHIDNIRKGNKIL